MSAARKPGDGERDGYTLVGDVRSVAVVTDEGRNTVTGQFEASCLDIVLAPLASQHVGIAGG